MRSIDTGQSHFVGGDPLNANVRVARIHAGGARHCASWDWQESRHGVCLAPSSASTTSRARRSFMPLRHVKRARSWCPAWGTVSIMVLALASSVYLVLAT